MRASGDVVKPSKTPPMSTLNGPGESIWAQRAKELGREHGQEPQRRTEPDRSIWPSLLLPAKLNRDHQVSEEYILDGLYCQAARFHSCLKFRSDLNFPALTSESCCWN